MVSAAIDIQDQSGCSGSNTVRSIGNGISMDQFTSGSEYALKARKPYTITKQRERWTDEEHKMFVEALKLYGRAWRRIEEHVGTKTAVQIRSHAQKFFSKVVRESSSSDANSVNADLVKPIEIPPPRPKRKPMHPYPRKNVSPFKSGTYDEQRMSLSPNISVSEQENQSPTTVLSAVGSDTDLSTPNSSPLISSEPNLSPEENGSSSQIEENASSSPAEQNPMKPEHLESFPEATATQSLKLFGKTVLITDSHRLSSPTVGNSNKYFPSDQNLEWNKPTTWDSLPCGPPGALYYMQLSNESSNPSQDGSSPFPWTLFPVLQLHNTVPVKECVSLDEDEAVEKELLKEGSWTGSNTARGDGDKNWDFDTQSNKPLCNKEKYEDKQKFTFRSSVGANPDNRKRGFVPYKRCISERDTQSSTITRDEREELRIRLCL